MKGLICIAALMLFIIAVVGTTTVAAQEVVARVVCGEPEDYEDNNGNIWVTADSEYNKNSWGGYREGTTMPNSTFGQNQVVVGNETGYDDFLFKNATWSSDNTPLLYDVNVVNGLYDINFLFDDHWTGAARVMDIIIEDKLILDDYIISDQTGIVLVETVSGIEVKDGVLSIDLVPTPGCGDPCATVNAFEIVGGPSAVKPADKLSTTWGIIKARDTDRSCG